MVDSGLLYVLEVFVDYGLFARTVAIFWMSLDFCAGVIVIKIVVAGLQSTSVTLVIATIGGGFPVSDVAGLVSSESIIQQWQYLVFTPTEKPLAGS